MTTSSNESSSTTSGRRSSGSAKSSNTTATNDAPANDSTASDTGNVMFTAEGTDANHGVPKVASGADYPESKQVAAGEWNPQTHGEPPDAKPARNF